MPRKGYKQTKEHKAKYNRKGKDNPFYGKHHSDKTKKIIGFASKNRINGKKGKKLSIATKKKISMNNARYWLGKKRPKQSERMQGENHPNFGKKHPGLNRGNENPAWIDGRSYFPYPSIFNKQLRGQIRKRENYTCQVCGMTEEEHLIVLGRVLSIHHIDYNKKNCDPENLATTCVWCNIRINFNREYWKEYFKKKLDKSNRCVFYLK